VRLGNTYQSLEPGDEVLALGMNRAMELLAKARAKVRMVGTHPKDGAPVEIRKGRFGPYAMHGKTIANLPRGMEMEEATVDDVVKLLAEKGKELPPRGAKGAKGKATPAARKAAAAQPIEATPAPKPAAPKKAAPKKPAAKKPAAKKPGAKAPARKPAAKVPAAAKAR
jgi:DNA topoisomerase-1